MAAAAWVGRWGWEMIVSCLEMRCRGRGQCVCERRGRRYIRVLRGSGAFSFQAVVLQHIAGFKGLAAQSAEKKGI